MDRVLKLIEADTVFA